MSSQFELYSLFLEHFGHQMSEKLKLTVIRPTNYKWSYASFLQKTNDFFADFQEFKFLFIEDKHLFWMYKLMFHLCEVKYFQRRALQPSLFLGRPRGNHNFKHCLEFNRRFDQVDQFRYVNNGKQAVEYFSRESDATFAHRT